MFSGIIEHTSRIISIERWSFIVQNQFDEPLIIGQSIAHDGACMTITDIYDDSYRFFAMQESLSRTNFGNKKVGDTFNVERCIMADTRIDWHFVSGHIDTVGTIDAIQDNSDDSHLIKIWFDIKYRTLIIEKWSIALNGVSLTIVEAGDDYFTVSIIPHTWNITNIGELSIWSQVNIEFDMIGKYIQRIYSK